MDLNQLAGLPSQIDIDIGLRPPVIPTKYHVARDCHLVQLVLEQELFPYRIINLIESLTLTQRQVKLR